jgi:hypothetical protein
MRTGRPFILAAGIALLGARAVAGQTTCGEPHYRWSEKTDTSLADKTPSDADISEILSGWAPRSITGKDKCAARLGREKKLYAVTGYVRRIKRHESDGDWHIEITEEEDSDVKSSCIIVEIPSPDFGSIYQTARDRLDSMLDTTSVTSAGDLKSPVLVRFVGPAFFDGYHQKKASNGTTHASQHGRCNASVKALWEIHPVYRVEEPVSP